MGSLSNRLLFFSMNDLVTIMALLLKLHGLLLMFTFNQKWKQEKNVSLLLLNQRKAIQKLRLAKKAAGLSQDVEISD